MNSGYYIASTYANWVSVNQNLVAKLRVQDALSSLCERAFTIPCVNATLRNWSVISAPMLFEMIRSEAELDAKDETDPFERMLSKKYIVEKYLGQVEADKFMDRFGYCDNASNLLDRIHTFIRLG